MRNLDWTISFKVTGVVEFFPLCFVFFICFWFFFVFQATKLPTHFLVVDGVKKTEIEGRRMRGRTGETVEEAKGKCKKNLSSVLNDVIISLIFKKKKDLMVLKRFCWFEKYKCCSKEYSLTSLYYHSYNIWWYYIHPKIFLLLKQKQPLIVLFSALNHIRFWSIG